MDPTGMSTRRAFVAACLATPLAGFADVSATPPLMLANRFRNGLDIDPTQFWVSEKLDGVRGYWNGRQLLTRGGYPIAAPRWFTSSLPAVVLDGELWGGRGTFESVSGVMRTEVPDDAAWRAIKYMVFDLPGHRGSFDDRRRELATISSRVGVTWLSDIEQFRVSNTAALHAKLRAIEAQGGEGLMLHRGDSLYAAGRTDALLKLKSSEDAEAKVIAYVSGNGKFDGLVGALVVERADGATFKIGSGLSDAQRRDPPPIGSWITYEHNGLTNSGLPRFARFVRVRADADP